MNIDIINDLRCHEDESDSDNDECRKNRTASSNSDDDDNDNENQDSKNADVKKVMKKANEAAKKKVTKRPRPKLDVDRLVSARGIGELCNLLKSEKFKGKGHEFADLDTMMHKFEYWAHRLVPHMAFDDFIEKAEGLGGKKTLKNRLQDLRSDYAAKLDPNDDEDVSRRLIELLPTIDPEATRTLPQEKCLNDIPNDDELNELFE